MRIFSGIFLAVVCAPWVLLGRLEPAICGTHPGKTQEELFLHRQAVRHRASGRAQAPVAVARMDAGQIALIDDSNGVVGRMNPFDLNQRTLRFVPLTPDAAGYRFELGDVSYDAAVAASAVPVKLGDDDTHQFNLPFPFPFSAKPTGRSSSTQMATRLSQVATPALPIAPSAASQAACRGSRHCSPIWTHRQLRKGCS